MVITVCGGKGLRVARITENDWRAAVGDGIADNTSLTRQVGTELEVAAPDAIWVWELAHREADIRARLPGITRVKFRTKREQTAAPETRHEQYAEYLESDHWRSLRQWALERASYRCQICNTSVLTLHVHHRTYARVGAELPGDLIVLCSECHSTFHDHGRLA